jgi:hypothetical protein
MWIDWYRKHQPVEPEYEVWWRVSEANESQISYSVEERHTVQWPKEKGQTTIYNTLHKCGFCGVTLVTNLGDTSWMRTGPDCDYDKHIHGHFWHRFSVKVNQAWCHTIYNKQYIQWSLKFSFSFHK